MCGRTRSEPRVHACRVGVQYARVPSRAAPRGPHPICAVACEARCVWSRRVCVRAGTVARAGRRAPRRYRRGPPRVRYPPSHVSRTHVAVSTRATLVGLVNRLSVWRFGIFLKTVFATSAGGSQTSSVSCLDANETGQAGTEVSRGRVTAPVAPEHVPVGRTRRRGVGWGHDCHAAHMTAQPALSATGPAISAGGGPQACICCMSVATLSVSSGDSSYARRMSPTSASCLR